MQCAVCNAALATGDIFCGNCGTPVAQAANPGGTETTPVGDSPAVGSTSKRIGVRVIVALVMVGVLAGAAFAFTPLGLLLQDENPLYVYVPEDAAIFVGVDLLEARKVLSDGRVQNLMDEVAPLLEDFMGQRFDQRDFEEMMSDELRMQDGLTLDDDVLPWIGRWTATWASPYQQDGRDRMEGCLLAQVRDVDAAQTSLEEFLDQQDQLGRTANVDGVRFTEVFLAGSGYIGIHEDTMIFCSDEDPMRDALQARDRDLASDQDFEELRGAVTGTPFIEGFANGSDISDLEGFNTSDLNLPDKHYAQIQLTQDGIEATYVSADTFDGKLPFPGTETANRLPEISFFAFSSSNLGTAIDAGIDSIADAADANRSEVEEELDYEMGFDVMRWVRTFEGSAGLALTDAGPFFEERVDLGVVAFSDVTTPRETDRLIDSLVREYDLATNREMIGDIEVTTTLDDLEIAVGVGPETVYVSSSAQNIEDALDSTLADSSSFNAATGLLPRGSDWLAYLDTERATNVITELIFNFETLAHETRDTLRTWATSLFATCRQRWQVWKSPTTSSSSRSLSN